MVIAHTESWQVSCVTKCGEVLASGAHLPLRIVVNLGGNEVHVVKEFLIGVFRVAQQYLMEVKKMSFYRKS